VNAERREKTRERRMHAADILPGATCPSTIVVRRRGQVMIRRRDSIDEGSIVALMSCRACGGEIATAARTPSRRRTAVVRRLPAGRPAGGDELSLVSSREIPAARSFADRQFIPASRQPALFSLPKFSSARVAKAAL